MIVQLDRIDFDHTPLAAATDALSVRVNATQPAGPWTRAAGPNKAAYALVPTTGQQLTINATFTFNPALPLPGASLMVRAVPVGGAMSVLGSVGATPIPIPAGGGGSSAPTPLPLTAVTIWNHGVGRYDVSWQWQMQLTAGGTWIDFDRSDHTIYVILDLPRSPWGQASDAPHQLLWPWTQVLDWACVWAHGVKVTSTADQAAATAAKRIEQGLFDLGTRANVPLEYYGLTQYTPSDSGVGQFFLTDFLALLAGQPAPGRMGVNCTDCAAAVVTFANALGCGLELHRIQRNDGGVGFDTNPTVKIGDAAPSGDFFGQHDIAIRRGATANTHHVYDACLMVDHDSNPASLKSSNLGLAHGGVRGPFSVVSAKQFKYVHRLIARTDWTNCEGADLNLPCLDACVDPQTPSAPLIELWNVFRELIKVLAPPERLEQPYEVNLKPVHVAGFYPYERVLQPVHLSVLRGLVEQSVEFFYVAKKAGEDRRLAISIGYSSSSAMARNALAWVLTQSDRPPRPILVKTRAVGDASFTSDATLAGFFVRGTVLARVRSIGRRPVPLTPIMKALDDVVRSVRPTSPFPFRPGTR